MEEINLQQRRRADAPAAAGAAAAAFGGHEAEEEQHPPPQQQIPAAPNDQQRGGNGGGGRGGTAQVHWLVAPLQVLLGAGSLATLGLLQRQLHLQRRCEALQQAPHVPVEQLDAWWNRQQMLHTARHSSHLDLPSSSAVPLPPQYVQLTGRAACAEPLLTAHTSTPQAAIWMLSFHVRRFFRLFPLTAVKMYELERKESHCESRDFQIMATNTPSSSLVAPTAATTKHSSVSRGIVSSLASSAAGSAASNFAAAGQSTAAVPASSSSSVVAVPPAPVPAVTTVHVPSSLPCEGGYIDGLVREVADVTRDVTLSSRDFMEQLASGKLQVQERHIERVIPVGQNVTLVGFVYKDPATGVLSVIPGSGSSSSSTAAGNAATSSSSSSAVSGPMPDLQAYSYDKNSRPCILSQMSPARLVEEESGRLASNKRWLLFAFGVTLLVGAALAGRYLYRNWERNQELKRIVFFHELRKERRAEQRRDKKERERRRAAKMKQKAARENALAMQNAQINLLQAAAASNMAAAAAASTMPSSFNPYAAAVTSTSSMPPQFEGAPQYPPLSPSPVWQQQQLLHLYQQQQQQQPFTTPSRQPFSPAAMRTGGSSPAPLPVHMRTSPPQHQHPHQHQQHPQQQQQHASAAGSMRSPSPYLSDAREGQSRRSVPTMQPQQLQQLQQAHQQQQQRHSLPNASVMAAPAPLCIIPADFAAGAQAPEEDMVAASSSVAAPSLDVDEFEGADDGSLNSEEDDEEDDSDSRAGGEDEEGADDCIICAEQRADACLVQCGHMYTCTSCAAKLSRCPICRCAVERVVKVFAQQM